jgi:hypothetical protein
MKIKTLMLTFMVFFILSFDYALALPCAFFGEVSIAGEPVNGTLVTAHRSTNGEYIATAKEAGFGKYTISVDVAGEYVKFKINGVWAEQEEQYCPSGNFTYLNLSLSCADCDNDGYNYTIDCNDTDNITYPNAPEMCDGMDNDCNEAIDDGTYYCDADSDGYYSKTATNCIPSGVDCINTQGNDCNDNNNKIHPGATDLCDGIDNGCRGGGGGGGGGGITARCGDGMISKWAGEECEKDEDCNASHVCEDCKCVFVCTENWVCTEWTSCMNGVQTRTCTDANNCGTTNNKPSESQPCTTTGGGSSEVKPLGTTICGNGECEDGEDCGNCPEDCGVCGAGAGAIVGTQSGLIGMIMTLPGLAALGLLILLMALLLLLFPAKRRKKKEGK